MGPISFGEAEMSGQTVDVAQEEEVRDGRKKDTNKTNKRTRRMNKNPLTAEKSSS